MSVPVNLTENEVRILNEIAQANAELQRQANEHMNNIRGRLNDVYTLLDDRYGTDLKGGVHVVSTEGQIIDKPEEQENEVAA